MTLAIVWFLDGSVAALTFAQYCSIDDRTVARVELVGEPLVRDYAKEEVLWEPSAWNF